jgi:hypothetical protein
MTPKPINQVTATGGRLPRHRELLGDADVASAGGDGDSDPDRPAGEQGDEDRLGEHPVAVEDGARYEGMGEQLDGAQEEPVDGVGNCEEEAIRRNNERR